MSYISNNRPWGLSPQVQVPGYHALQKSSDGPQEVAFTTYDEIFIQFLTGCKVTIAASAAAATTNFGAGVYNKKAAGDFGAYYKQTGVSVFLLNDADAEATDGFETVKYKY